MVGTKAAGFLAVLRYFGYGGQRWEENVRALLNTYHRARQFASRLNDLMEQAGALSDAPTTPLCAREGGRWTKPPRRPGSARADLQYKGG